MMLAGIGVVDRHVLELASKLRDAGCDDTAARLESGYEHQAKLLALSPSRSATRSSPSSSTAPTGSASCGRCFSNTNGADVKASRKPGRLAATPRHQSADPAPPRGDAGCRGGARPLPKVSIWQETRQSLFRSAEERIGA